MQHKLKNGINSNSEDALTWSCFDVIANLSATKKRTCLTEVFEDSFAGENTALSDNPKEDEPIEVYIGKQYCGATTNESTEVDASIEMPGKLIFIEAKLYSSVSMAAPPEKPHDQIARKLRVGLDIPLGDQREFWFIFLDIAPLKKLNQRAKKEDVLAPGKGDFHDKWKAAWLFDYYKNGRNNSLKPLTEALEGLPTPPAEHVARNMGWLTWSDLYKSVLRSVLA
jgi:hypothetical protein